MSGGPGKSAAILTVTGELAAGRTPDASDLAAAVRTLLRALSAAAPGRSVEVRVPPFGAVQCVDGPRHTRGTPPNLVEADPVTWVEVATGQVSWATAVATGRVQLSGGRADLSAYLPLWAPGDAESGRDVGHSRR
ncbi:hypothetical protein JQS43_24975 [Natronosporangium hydrolyticum]|uniref:Bacterial SCP orthologue domain-containing protein n=1 Tax=Natronosporangium hydrolyticum TaxID=2811111 RepID=A0A895YA77_9ACTN|nr:sterol carrier family protein [Natronosporangium hydrolyticum]QSB14674.1 hypothetical protein JQS43_24975 [Natronosporangium hydrolyticum]